LNLVGPEEDLKARRHIASCSDRDWESTKDVNFHIRNDLDVTL
jgi:hypothetical protein